MPAPDDKPWCERCGEELAHGEDAIRTGGPSHWRRNVRDARDAWWHVECHAAAVVRARENAAAEERRLGVEWRPKPSPSLDDETICAMAGRVHA